MACVTEPGLLDAGPNFYGNDIVCGETGGNVCQCEGLPDGNYCGSSSELADHAGDPDDLVECRGGQVIAQTPCPSGCLDNPAPVNDACVQAQDCGNGVVQVGESCDGEPCCSDCAVAPLGTICESGAETEYRCQADSMRGEVVEVRSHDRLCSGLSTACDGEYGDWGPWELFEACSVHESCEPDEFTCSCNASEAWAPAGTSSTDDDGTEHLDGEDILIPTKIRIELAPSVVFGHLTVRACKDEEAHPNFQNDVYLYLESPSNLVLFDGVLTKNGECTNNAEIFGEETYVEGELFDGAWRLNSPAWTSPMWSNECTSGAQAQGACWHREAFDVGLERTCANP